MNGAPKPYNWVEYKDDNGEAIARCIRVFDATIWEVWRWHTQSDEERAEGKPRSGYWIGPIAVPDPHPAINDQLYAEAQLHKETHRKQHEQLGRIERELKKLGDIVDALNAERVLPHTTSRLNIRDRLRAAIAAWKEGQH